MSACPTSPDKRSREDKDAEPEDIDEFIRDVPKLFKDHSIDPRAHLQWDEFNDIRGLTRRRMVHSDAALKNHCPKSLSCGFLLSPTWIGRACVLTDSCSRETEALIQSELQKHVKLIVNKTGNMYGTTHAREFLPNFIGPESRKLKRVLELPETAPYFRVARVRPCRVRGRALAVSTVSGQPVQR